MTKFLKNSSLWIPWSSAFSDRKSRRFLKSVQTMVRLHIFPIFSFLAKMLSFLCIKDNSFDKMKSELLKNSCRKWTWNSSLCNSYLNSSLLVALIYFGLTFSSISKDISDLKACRDYLYHQARSMWKFEFFRPFVLTWLTTKKNL